MTHPTATAAARQSAQHKQFHIQYHGPSEPWPRGSFALYEISGDEIARRVTFGGDGVAVRRESWPGYIGMFDSANAVADAIAKATEAQ